MKRTMKDKPLKEWTLEECKKYCDERAWSQAVTVQREENRVDIVHLHGHGTHISIHTKPGKMVLPSLEAGTLVSLDDIIGG